MDYDLEKAKRTCAATQREIAAGEPFFSVLIRRGVELHRLDYAAEAWPGPPTDAVGWWKSTMPDQTTRKPKQAPSEILLELFREPADDPRRRDLRYVLTLMLVRRRLLRIEESADDGGRTLTVHCPRDERTYTVEVAVPTPERAAEIQTYLSQLFAAPLEPTP